MHPDFKVIAATNCQDGNCPTFWVNPNTGTVRVRGYDPVTGQEMDVDIPASAWSQLAPQIAASITG